MGLTCFLFGHDWRCHGGVAADVAGDGYPPNVQYGCGRCGERRTVWGIETKMVANLMILRSDPDKAEEISGDVHPHK